MTISRARTRERRRLAVGATLLLAADSLLGFTPWLLLAGACAYVFSNIAFNAVQHTHTGGTIRLGWVSGGTGARLEVTDTGEGIEAPHIPRLTERFYRVDKARSHERGGTGLGLAIVKHVLVRHDARLEIESRLGEGSRFSCRFPAHRVVHSEARAELEREAVG